MLHELSFEHCGNSKDPLTSCALEGVANIIAGIRDAAVVIHSPQGCSATVAGAYDAHEIDFTKRRIACSRLFETDIIMGATQKLQDLILQADAAFQTKVLFVVGTCAADIIGEDLSAVCRSLHGRVKARLIPVMAGGFHGDSYDGMNLGLSILLPFLSPEVFPEVMAQEPGRDPVDRQEKGAPDTIRVLPEHRVAVKTRRPTVNLLLPQANLNPTWWADAEWVKTVLMHLGVSVGALVPKDVSLEELSRATGADADILLSHDAGFSFAKKLEGAGVPLILGDLPLPVGIENTGRWLRALGSVFHAENKAGEIVAAGEARVQDILRKRGLMIIPRYRNCRVALSADCTIGIPLVRTLFQELEMIPELLLFRSDSPQARKILESELAELGIHPRVVFAADGWKITSALKTVAVDAVFGSSWEKYIAEEQGIKLSFDALSPTNRDRYIDRAYFGYDGLLNLLEVIGNDWEASFRSRKIAGEQFAQPGGKGAL
jgi:nitrogenase molybdenum-iron protein alpha/beta subunit